MQQAQDKRRDLRPRLSTIAGIGGVLWNVFGVYRFASTSLADRDGLVRAGMTGAQADLYLGLPLWMTLAFAVGVLGGLVGSGMLIFGSRRAVPVLGTSLAAYTVLFVGDIVHGVFAAFGLAQVVILTVVVMIAAALFWVSLRPVEPQVDKSRTSMLTA